MTHPSLYTVAGEAVSSILREGYSPDLADRWVQRLSEAATRSYGPSGPRAKQVGIIVRGLARSLVEKGGALAHHKGLDKHNLASIRMDVQGMANQVTQTAQSIVNLHRTQLTAQALARFLGWASSVTPGTKVNRRDLKRFIIDPLSSLPVYEQGVVSDQAAKFSADVDYLIARRNSAIGAIWHSRFREKGYDYRHDHKDRDGRFYPLIASPFYTERYVDAPYGCYEQHEAAGEWVHCRCHCTFLYRLGDVPVEYLTEKGMRHVSGG